MSNYPDDIRQYDDHPHSPFYVTPTYLFYCPECVHYFHLEEGEDEVCEECGSPDVVEEEPDDE